MAAPQNAALPPDLELTGDYTIRLTAIDATTGNLVTGVVVSSASYQVNPQGTTTPADLTSGPYLYVPAAASVAQVT